ncbi:MAG: nicotinate-nucleotide--dimethylbenzimidazole phosphoribosyltransferase [Anaeromyxobacter sp.]
MTLLQQTLASLPDLDLAAATAALRHLEARTSPGSLGRLEPLACTLAAIQGRPDPRAAARAVVLMAGDHGVAAEGAAALPATRQRLAELVRGGAAINVLAEQAGAALVVVDMGVVGPPLRLPGVRQRRVGPGTRDFTRGPAMTREEAECALAAGIALAAELQEEGVEALALGELGAGSSTAAAALAAALTGAAPAEVTGRDAGADAAAHRRKLELVRHALAAHALRRDDPLGAVAALGGFELAGLAGLVLGAAARRIPVVLDGFGSSVAGLLASRLAPRAGRVLVASHRSAEAGHGLVLEALGLRPLLELDLRMGEGTGAALALPLLETAARLLVELAPPGAGVPVVAG